MRRLLAAALLSLLLLPALAAGETTAGETRVAIAGPDRLEVSSSGGYNVKIFGPADIKWGFWVNVSGDNRDAATMTSPEGKSDAETGYVLYEQSPLQYPEFNFTLTAPPRPGTITLTVTVHALEGAAASGQTASTQWSVDIKAQRHVTLNATVVNSGAVPVQNVKVSFQVKLGGAWSLISNASVPSIEPGQTQNVTAVWNSSLLDSGTYTVRMVIDPDHEYVQYSGGSSIIEREIVLRDPDAKEEKPPAPGLIAFIAILIAVGIGGAYWYRKRKIV